MKRSLFWISVAALLALLLGLASQFDIKTETLPAGPGGRARIDPWLGLEHWLEHLGGKLQKRSLFTTPPRQLGPQDWLVIGHWPVEAQQDVLDWVQQGGRLWWMLSGNPEEAPPQLEALETLWLPNTQDRAQTLIWPGQNQARLSDIWCDGELQTEHPGLQLKGQDGACLITLAYGQGVIVLSTLPPHWMRYNNLARPGHAEMLYQILWQKGAPGTVWWYPQDHGETPGLWTWLIEHSPGSVGSAILLIALLLWHSWPRQGRMQADPAAIQRSALTHARAAGFFRWRAGARSELLSPARQHLEHELARIDPRWRWLSPPQRASLLARRFAISEDQALTALISTPDDPAQLIELVRLLQKMR